MTKQPPRPRDVNQLAKHIADLARAGADARERLTRIDAEAEALRAEIAQLVEENGGLCPTCGAPVSAETLLDHQAHSAVERMTA